MAPQLCPELTSGTSTASANETTAPATGVVPVALTHRALGGSCDSAWPGRARVSQRCREWTTTFTYATQEGTHG
jgi:hypothetical protein